MLRLKFPSGLVSLTTPLAEASQQIVRQTCNLEAAVVTATVSLGFDFVAQAKHFARECIAIDLTDVCPPFVDSAGLECFPPTLRAIVREVRGYGVRVELRIQFAAGVVFVHCDCHVASDPIFIGAVLPNACGRVTLCFFQCFGDCRHVRVAQSIFITEDRQDGYGFRCAEGKVIQSSPLALSAAVFADPVRTMPRPEKIPRSRIKPLAQCLEIFVSNRALEA